MKRRPYDLLSTAVALVGVIGLLCACGGPGGADKNNVTFAYSNSIMQVEKVPIHLALDAMKDQDLPTEESYFQSGDDAVAAVARGDADFGTANASTVFAAIKKGVPIQGVMTSSLPGYVLVAPSSVTDPGGLNGKRVGLQSKISSTTLYTDLALSNYPQAEPNRLIVPSSASRVQAMLAGELDASVVQLADWLTLRDKAPDKFHIIYEVAKQNPDIIDSIIFTNKATIKSNPDYVHTVVQALRAEYGSISNDPDTLASHLARLVPDTSPEHAAALAKQSTEDAIWPPDGGFSSQKINATLEALKGAGLLTDDTLPTSEQCCTDQFLR